MLALVSKSAHLPSKNGVIATYPRSEGESHTSGALTDRVGEPKYD